MIYFDSAATTLQKPASVARAVAEAIGAVTTPGRGDHPAARRAAGRKKNAPLNQSLPLEDASPAPGPEELAIHREQPRATVADIQTRLSPFEREVLAAHLAGGSYRQIAWQLGCTPKAVENALARLRRKLRGGHPTH